MSEYAATYDKNNIEKTGIPEKEYEELHQGNMIMFLRVGCGSNNYIYTELADGGAGLICFGNIPIDRDNLENYYNAVLDPRNPWDPVEAFAPPIRAAKSRGAICLPQIQYPGRQVPEFLNPNPRSASDVQLKPCLDKTYGKPTPLTLGEIDELISRYAWAAQVMAKAGADGIIVRCPSPSYAAKSRLLTFFVRIASRCPWLPVEPVPISAYQSQNGQGIQAIFNKSNLPAY